MDGQKIPLDIRHFSSGYPAASGEWCRSERSVSAARMRLPVYGVRKGEGRYGPVQADRRVLRPEETKSVTRKSGGPARQRTALCTGRSFRRHGGGFAPERSGRRSEWADFPRSFPPTEGGWIVAFRLRMSLPPNGSVVFLICRERPCRIRSECVRCQCRSVGPHPGGTASAAAPVRIWGHRILDRPDTESRHPRCRFCRTVIPASGASL